MSPPALRIALLACNKRPDRFEQDASYLYRCTNLAAALRRMGHQVLCAHHRHVPLVRLLPGNGRHFDIAVFHRPRLDAGLWMRLKLLRAQGVRLIADFDDLIFQPELAAWSPGVLNQSVSLKFTRQQFARSAAALALFDGYTVSTEPLADALRTQLAARDGAAGTGRLVKVVPNAVPLSWRELALNESPAALLPQPAPHPPAPVLAYLPGTASHDRDFAGVLPIIQELLRRLPSARLQVTGPLRGLEALPTGQWKQQPRLPFADYHRVFEGVRVNLAPLERTVFTECKSAVKVLEAAFWGIPTVATAVPDVQRFQVAGAWLPADEREWLTMLERLLTDDGIYQAATEHLRARVLALADIQALAVAWLQTWAVGLSEAHT